MSFKPSLLRAWVDILSGLIGVSTDSGFGNFLVTQRLQSLQPF